MATKTLTGEDVIAVFAEQDPRRPEPCNSRLFDVIRLLCWSNADTLDEQWRPRVKKVVAEADSNLKTIETLIDKIEDPENRDALINAIIGISSDAYILGMLRAGLNLPATDPRTVDAVRRHHADTMRSGRSSLVQRRKEYIRSFYTLDKLSKRGFVSAHWEEISRELINLGFGEKDETGNRTKPISEHTIRRYIAEILSSQDGKKK